ncbi:hypothetical protein MRB53_039791 [Persea americana]|nr:hypothetical protein MRB53_039791 [Persea americana]
MLSILYFAALILAQSEWVEQNEGIIVVNHDNIEDLPETVNAHQIEKIYQPVIQLQQGCSPYSAVGRQGEVSGGLHVSGDADGDCAFANGNAYVRNATIGSHQVFVYAYYRPKSQEHDEGYWAPVYDVPGRRHSWEVAGLWFNAERKPSEGPLAITPMYDDIEQAEVKWLRAGTHPILALNYFGLSASKAKAFIGYSCIKAPLSDGEFDVVVHFMHKAFLELKLR